MAFKLPKNIEQIAAEHGIHVSQEPTPGDRILKGYTERKKRRGNKKQSKARELRSRASELESRGRSRRAGRLRAKADRKDEKASKKRKQARLADELQSPTFIAMKTKYSNI